jgi:hypothetical protein
MLIKYLLRRDSSMPYQNWNAFPSEAIVQVKNAYGDNRIAVSKDLWWGYESECGEIDEGVIIAARRLDKPNPPAIGSASPTIGSNSLSLE